MTIKVGDNIWVCTHKQPVIWRRAYVTGLGPGLGDDIIAYFNFDEGRQRGSRWLKPDNIRPVSPLVLLAECSE